MDLKLVLLATAISCVHGEKVIPNTNLGIGEGLHAHKVALPSLVKNGMEMEHISQDETTNDVTNHLGIIGGLTTNITDHPFQVAINSKKQFVCSGALLNRIWVIALASCTLGTQASGLEVRLGSNNNVYGGTLYNVTLIVNHPNFNYSGMDYDFALLKLDTYICFDPDTNKVDFSIRPPKNNYQGIISGWGKDDKDGKSVYRQLQMRIINNKWCANKYDVTGDTITSRMFCAVAGKKGPCYSDFGDPLVVNGTLYGLYSWSRGCANPNYPAVFSNLATLADWIHSVMNNDHFCSCARF